MQNPIYKTETISGIILLLGLIFSIFLLPVLPIEWQEQSSRIVYTIIYFSAYFSLEPRIKPILILSILAVCMEWLAGLLSIWALATVSKSLNIIFFLIVVGTLIYQVATARRVTLEVILGAIIGYLMLGLVYSIFIAFIMQQDPEAFNITRNLPDGLNPITHLGESIYFSFVSMTTVGYGDILPIKPYTRSFSIFISISGQLYIAVIIALLVGKFASGNKCEES